MKPTRCTNFSNLFLEKNSACFRQFICPSSGVFHCTHSNGICHNRFVDCLRAGSGRPDPDRKLSAHIPLLCAQWKTPDNGQRNWPKHVEFYSKNKFEKLVHLVGFIIINSSYPVNHCFYEDGEIEQNWAYRQLPLVYICNVSECKGDLNIFVVVNV